MGALNCRELSWSSSQLAWTYPNSQVHLFPSHSLQPVDGLCWPSPGHLLATTAHSLALLLRLSFLRPGIVSFLKVWERQLQGCRGPELLLFPHQRRFPLLSLPRCTSQIVLPLTTSFIVHLASHLSHYISSNISCKHKFSY